MTQFDYDSSREAFLIQVDQAGFAMTDAALYLDTHPCDTAAVSYYNQMAQAYRGAAAEYEARFGPLRACSLDSASYWSWVEGPWPWEGGC